jgi:DNA-binding HxlR family transcriptional regulator
LRKASRISGVTRRSYGQFCALALALDRIGDRWTLLIVRELLMRPRGYSELRAALPGIASNLLAERLRQLESDGLISRDEGESGRPRYDLTRTGRELEEPIMALVRWGGRWIGDASPQLAFRPEWLVLALRAVLPELADDLPVIELRVGDGAVHLRPHGKSIEVASGSADRPAIVVSTDPTTLLGVAAGKLSLVDAVAQGRAEAAGDRKILRSVSSALRAGRS